MKACNVALGLVFLVAGTGKVLVQSEFIHALGRYSTKTITKIIKKAFLGNNYSKGDIPRSGTFVTIPGAIEENANSRNLDQKQHFLRS